LKSCPAPDLPRPVLRSTENTSSGGTNFEFLMAGQDSLCDLSPVFLRDLFCAQGRGNCMGLLLCTFKTGERLRCQIAIRLRPRKLLNNPSERNVPPSASLARYFTAGLSERSYAAPASLGGTTGGNVWELAPLFKKAGVNAEISTA
jgi:hypothetical protein